MIVRTSSGPGTPVVDAQRAPTDLVVNRSGRSQKCNRAAGRGCCRRLQSPTPARAFATVHLARAEPCLNAIAPLVAVIAPSDPGAEPSVTRRRSDRAGWQTHALASTDRTAACRDPPLRIAQHDRGDDDPTASAILCLLRLVAVTVFPWREIGRRLTDVYVIVKDPPADQGRPASQCIIHYIARAVRLKPQSGQSGKESDCAEPVEKTVGKRVNPVADCDSESLYFRLLRRDRPRPVLHNLKSSSRNPQFFQFRLRIKPEKPVPPARDRTILQTHPSPRNVATGGCNRLA